MSRFNIATLASPTRQDLADVNSLLPQIADKPHLLSFKELSRVVARDSCKLLVARVQDVNRRRIVGMSALTLVYVPTGLVAMIEDVVVDNNYRGMGIGQALVLKMIGLARVKKAKHISLTTNPKRVAANRLYEKLRFFKKETNYYRINLVLPKPSKIVNKT